MLILAINSGSSSIKSAIIDPLSGDVLFAALVENLTTPSAVLHVTAPTPHTPVSVPSVGHEAALEHVLRAVQVFPGLWAKIEGVGHRVVHGGEHFQRSVVIDDEVVALIERCSSLAPLHNPANVLGIQGARRAFPQLPHVAVFDTAFHQTMPEHAYRYAVPRAWYEEHGVRRYGFHGTSHRFVADQAAQLLRRPLSDVHLLTAHLGNGCSATAISAGKCVDTTMGLTPLEGLVMGTRSGDIDPSLIFSLHRAGMTVDAIETALNRESGLLGLSGLSNDMRTLTHHVAESPGARLAIDVFCHRLAKHLGGLWTNLDKVHALVFTGGIGEHSALVRGRVCARLAAFGVRFDEQLNAEHATFFHAPASSCALMVVPTNEELLIARDTLALTQPRSPRPWLSPR
jgi:acetate kinase